MHAIVEKDPAFAQRHAPRHRRAAHRPDPPGGPVRDRPGRGRRRADPADDRRCRPRSGARSRSSSRPSARAPRISSRSRSVTPSATWSARWASRPSCSNRVTRCASAAASGTAVMLPHRTGPAAAPACASRASSAAARASGSSSRTELRAYGEVVVCTDDGSVRPAGLRHPGAGRRDRRGQIDVIYAVGPVPMMRAVAEMTRPSRRPHHGLAQPDHGRRHRHVRRLPRRASAARRSTPASTDPSSTPTRSTSRCSLTA